MPLLPVAFETDFDNPTPDDPPDDIARFIARAHAHVDRFIGARIDNPAPGFVPSDFTMTYRALREIRRRRLAPGPRFCEWGSGCGVVACLAAMLGFHAYGIEVDPDLVRASELLADTTDVRPVFARGSFLPDDLDDDVFPPNEFIWLDTETEAAYEELGFDADDFDLVFAYPWPGEEQVLFDIFESAAADQALLLSYHGLNQMRLQRKVARRGRRRSSR